MFDAVRINSKDNRRLVELRKLRLGAVDDRIFLEGRRLIEEAFRSRIRIEEVFFADSFRDEKLLEEVARGAEFAAELPDRIFQTVADTRSPQGVIATARRPVSETADLLARIESGSLPLVVMLEGVNNPSNLGAIVRTAEAADAAGVIVTRGSADVFSPKALRAAMGSSLRLPIVGGLETEAGLAWAGANGFLVTATDAHSGKEYTSCDWTMPRLLIFGSEAHGVQSDLRKGSAEAVLIPMSNGVESLNLGVSAGIIMYEARRQCRQRTG
jgi:TrmH family RNA methyltransferase